MCANILSLPVRSMADIVAYLHSMLQYRHDSLSARRYAAPSQLSVRCNVDDVNVPDMEGARKVDEATTASAVITNDGELAALLRSQPAVGIAALYDRYGRLVFSM